MSTAEKIEAIREECARVNPLITSGESDRIWDNAVRRFGLADILLAISHSEENWRHEDNGCVFAEMGENQDFVELNANNGAFGRWNLLQDDLALQDPPTIDFIHQVLIGV